MTSAAKIGNCFVLNINYFFLSFVTCTKRQKLK